MKKEPTKEKLKEKRVHFNQNIELSNPQTYPKAKKQNLLNNNEVDDEDILKKFQEKKRRKNISKNNFNREKAFSTVRHQIKDEFSLGKLGKIEWAKEHASANRPMNKINEFTKSTNFCNCCNLPCETPGVIERFSCSENTENFSVCGKAVPLYFYFIRYCICILILVLFIMSIPTILINHINLLEIENYCNSLINNNIEVYDNGNNITSICEKYMETNNSEITNFFNWFSKVSSDNILDYKKLLSYTGNSNYEKNITNYSIVGFCCMISLFIINIYFIILFKAKIKAEKIDNIQPSDYTVLITDLQKMVNEFKEKNEEREPTVNENNTQDDLISRISDYEFINTNYLKTQIGQFTQFLIDNLFYSQKSKKNLDIFNLNLCYKLNDFMILKEKQENCKYKIFQIKNNPHQIEKNHENSYIKENRRYYTSPFTLIGLDWLCCSNKGVPLEELNQENSIYEKNLKSLVTKAKLNNFCGCIFATFNTLKDKEEFYNNYPHFFIETIFYFFKNIKFYICCCFIDKKNKINKNRERIRVYLAPEPEDVIWENMEFTVFQRFYRIIFIYFLSFLFIGIGFLIVYQLNEYQEHIEKQIWSDILKYIASFSITIIVSILNVILEVIMKLFTKMEKPKSMTSYYLSYSIKLAIFTFMTSALIPFLSNYLSGKLKEHDNKTLITNMLFLFLTNSFLKPIVWTLNISLIIKKIRIFFIERKKVPNSMHFKTQKELNDLYEYPEMDIASKYSYISMTLLMTMFYLPIFPLGVAITLLGLILAYFLEKFNFTHHYKRPEMLNEKLGEFYFNFFISIIVSYSLGDYFFNNGLFTSDTWSYVNIIIFGSLSLIPYTKPISYYFNSSKAYDINSVPINNIYFSFCNDYQRQNPFTKKEGMYFYVTELKNRGYISKFLYDILIKNIEKINVMEIYYNTSKNPSLNQTQKSLTRIKNKKFSMEDLKKSITRIFREKFQNSRNSIEERNQSKSTDIITKNDFIVGALDKNENKKENEIKNETEEDNNLNDNDNANNKNIKKDDNNMNFRRNTDISKSTSKSSKVYNINDDSESEDNNYCLTQAFTNRGNFLINQYKDPLLFSIGTGIKNLTFLSEAESKKSSLSKIPSISSEENDNDNNTSEENDVNIVVEEKEEDDEENTEEKNEEDENVEKENIE